MVVRVSCLCISSFFIITYNCVGFFFYFSGLYFLSSCRIWLCLFLVKEWLLDVYLYRRAVCYCFPLDLFFVTISLLNPWGYIRFFISSLPLTLYCFFPRWHLTSSSVWPQTLDPAASGSQILTSERCVPPCQQTLVCFLITVTQRGHTVLWVCSSLWLDILARSHHSKWSFPARAPEMTELVSWVEVPFGERDKGNHTHCF